MRDLLKPDAVCWEILGKSESMNQDKPFLQKSHWKQLGWTWKLGGVGPQGITRMWQTLWAWLVKTQIWSLPAGSVEGTMASDSTSDWQRVVCTTSPLTPPWFQTIQSLPARIFLIPFKLLPQLWSSKGVSLSKCEGPLRGTNCLGLQQPRPTQSQSPEVFRHCSASGECS